MITDNFDAICIYALIVGLCKLNLSMRVQKLQRKFLMSDIEKIGK
jgi:hypothetical protein